MFTSLLSVWREKSRLSKWSTIGKWKYLKESQKRQTARRARYVAYIATPTFQGPIGALIGTTA